MKSLDKEMKTKVGNRGNGNRGKSNLGHSNLPTEPVFLVRKISIDKSDNEDLGQGDENKGVNCEI